MKLKKVGNDYVHPKYGRVLAVREALVLGYIGDEIDFDPDKIILTDDGAFFLKKVRFRFSAPHTIATDIQLGQFNG